MKRCKQQVRSDMNMIRYYPCTLKYWKDGFCKMHHPISVAKREKKRELAWKNKMERMKIYSSKDLSDVRRVLGMVLDFSRNELKKRNYGLYREAMNCFENLTERC